MKQTLLVGLLGGVLAWQATGPVDAQPRVVRTYSGGIAYVYDEPIGQAQVVAMTGTDPAPLIYRWTENTVPPTAEEIASNPFLRHYSP